MDSQANKWNYSTLAVSTPIPYVAHVELNRPEKGNAMNPAFWREMVECFTALGKDSDIRVIVISGQGKIFSGGMDISCAMEELQMEVKDPARRARWFSDVITRYQQSFTQIEQCPQPVIAAVHSACVGGGLDLVSACDVRFCSKNAYFQVKEVDLGLAADVGVLQRLPKVMGNNSLVRDMCYTARKVYSEEALQHGLVSRILDDRESCVEAALNTAADIAEKSPVAVQTTKEALNYARDHSIADGLDHIRLLNQCMLQSEDFMKAIQASLMKQKPVFGKL